MTERYKEVIQGARDCVERNKDGGVYLPDLLVVIDSQQTQIDKMLEDLQFRSNQVIEQQADIEEMHKRVMRLDSEREEWSRSATTEQLKNIELQAEIERLQNDIAISRKETKRYATRRSEAIKEFAERLKAIIIKCPKNFISITAKDIDRLVKEMVGEDK